jgi:hypothetical protein
MSEEKLDRFLPSKEMYHGIKMQLVKAGIDPTAIPEDWLITILAAVSKWQLCTQDGIAETINNLGFDWTTGKDEVFYEYFSPVGTVEEVNSKDIHFFAGASIRGRPIKPSNIIISKRDEFSCSSCGVKTYCVKEVRNPVIDDIESICNACLTLHENRKMRDKTEGKECSTCTEHKCYHNPRYIGRKQLDGKGPGKGNY